jgi:uncharacterized membrane protein YqjE
MGKHFLAITVVLLVLCLGYGMWLYSESLRTSTDFGILLKQDLESKRQSLSELMVKEND